MAVRPPLTHCHRASSGIHCWLWWGHAGSWRYTSWDAQPPPMTLGNQQSPSPKTSFATVVKGETIFCQVVRWVCPNILRGKYTNQYNYIIPCTPWKRNMEQKTSKNGGEDEFPFRREVTSMFHVHFRRSQDHCGSWNLGSWRYGNSTTCSTNKLSKIRHQHGTN